MIRKMSLLCFFAVVSVGYAAKAPFEKNLPSDFSVDITETTADGAQTTSKLYVSGPNVRKETWLSDGQKIITIMRTDKGIYYETIPGARVYVKVNVPSDASTSLLGYSFDRKWKNLGDETIDGVPCIKYLGYSTIPMSMQPVKNYFWVRKDNHMLKRSTQMMPVMGKWKESVLTTTDWDNIQIGSQPSRLFRVPRGYKVIDQTQMLTHLMEQMP